ncbi:hypothetical protein MKZ38_008257 [Zalerion maritima]|uniref:Uncharacterized protein n=1 Tax=Zalerion maritima TaxID=339359 RepID=A0AAD5WV77_9PEZI|nr:hypothetical protein MKZ38_008257 [Zalerion maritima]
MLGTNVSHFRKSQVRMKYYPRAILPKLRLPSLDFLSSELQLMILEKLDNQIDAYLLESTSKHLYHNLYRPWNKVITFQALENQGDWDEERAQARQNFKDTLTMIRVDRNSKEEVFLKLTDGSEIR